MAAPIKPHEYTQDIRKPVLPRQGGGLMFTGDALADTISVRMYDGPNEHPISGTVVCNCIRADGATVPVTGSISGNTAQATLVQACCAVPGPLAVVMKVVNGGTTSTVLKAVYTVDVSETGTVIDPGTIIQDVAAMIAAIEEAVATIPPDYSALTNESRRADTTLYDELGYMPLVWEQGNISSSGESSSSKNIRTVGYYAAATGDTLVYSIAENYALRVLGYGGTTQVSYISGLGTLTGTGTLAISTAGVTHVRMCLSRSSQTAITPDVGYSAVMVRVSGDGRVNGLIATMQAAEAKLSIDDNRTSSLIGRVNPTWEQGNIISGAEESSSANIRTGYIAAQAGTAYAYSVDSGYVGHVYLYSAASAEGYMTGLGNLTDDGKFTIPDGTTHIRFTLNLASEADITPDAGDAHFVVRATDYADIYSKIDATSDAVNAMGADGEIAPVWEQGNLTSEGESDSGNVIRSASYIPTGDIWGITAEVSSDAYEGRVLEYDASKTYISQTATNGTAKIILNANTRYIRVKLSYASGSTPILPSAGPAHMQVYFGTGRRSDPVTPQMYGAKGDGLTDDTAAFQAALNSGHDVFVPTTRGETYRITGTLLVPNSCKRIYGECPRGTATIGSIRFERPTTSSADRDTPLFRIGNSSINTEALTIHGLTIACEGVNGSRTGLCIDAATSTYADKDITISDVIITNFYRIVKFQGRGFTVINSSLTSSNYIGTFDWDDQYDTNNNHPASMDQRAILFKNCRLHSLTNGFITINSGHAYGLTMVGCTADVGRGIIIDCADEAWNWLITGNTFLGMHCHTTGGSSNGPAINFRGGAKNCVIADNVFAADPTFWSDGYIPKTYLSVNGGSGLTINGNNFRHCTDECVILTGVTGATISGNTFDAVGADGGAAIKLSGTCSRIIVTDNTLPTDPDGGLLDSSGATLTGCVVDDNGDGTQQSKLPAAPTTDGTYLLRATVSGGAATYSWESAT